jgi:uncharacterized protein YdeI (YjbR/CyaY-like superfamily)
MNEVDAIKAISDAFEKLDAKEQARVLNWAQSKYGSTTPAAAPPVSQPQTNAPQKATNPALPAQPKALKKGKTVISMDKSLNLSPKGKDSAVQFANAKSPSNVMQKCVVAIYYLRDVIEMEKVTAQAVFTFFKTVQWPVPADLKNTLQQAGTAGWLDTANSEDIKLTSAGENLIEHTLPTKTKA